MTPFGKELAARLYVHRQALGLSQQAVADRMRSAGLRWGQATVWEVERGERHIRFEEAIELASIFSTTLDDLAGRRAPIGDAERCLLHAVRTAVRIFEEER